MKFLIFSLFFLLPFANGHQIMVEIEPNWMPLPEYRSLLEPEEHREVFQSKRFELQIYKEAIQEGISIAGTRVAKERDLFLFENIPEDWMEPTGVVLEIKLPPILMVKKLLLNEESFYQPRIRRPFRILRNRDNLIYKFTILENPERIFRHDILLPMGETPTGGNEVAYMESLNNSLARLEQNEQLCAQTKYECNLNLLLKYTHVERQFDGFLRKVSKRTLTVSKQNYDKIATKSDKLFNDIAKLAMTVIGEEKKLFKENVSSSIDLHYSSPTIPILQLHSQHQHGLNSSQSSQTHQTPTSGTRSSAGVLPLNGTITFKLMTIERIAQILSGLDPSRISQPSQINIPAGTNQERMKFIMSDFLSPNSLNSGQFAHVQVGRQQQGVGQTSHGGPSAGQTQEKGKEKVANVVQPATNVEEISSSEENTPKPVGQTKMPSSENVPVVENVEKNKQPITADELPGFDDREDVWARDDAILDRRIQEQQERFELGDLLKAKKKKVYRWFHNIKSRMKTQEKTRRDFESEKKKYQAEMAATGGDNASASASASANRAKNAVHGTRFDVHQRAALWKHFVKFEDVLFTQSADVDRQREEDDERRKLANLIGLTPRQIYNWIFNIKLKLSKNSEIIRQEFESEKRKYQSEIAAIAGGGKDKASASASAPAEVPPNVDLNLNLERSNANLNLDKGNPGEDKMQEDD